MGSIDKLILSSVTCTRCGSGYGKCDCWTSCSCGWTYAKDETCRNPRCGGDGSLSIVAMNTAKRRRKK